MKSLLSAVGLAGMLSLRAGAETDEEAIRFLAVNHASFVIQTGKRVIAVDPVGTAAPYLQAGQPGLVIITHGHGDHFAPDVLKELQKPETVVVGPEAVIDQFGSGKTLKNGGQMTVAGVLIEAVPAYNLTPERKRYHPKGVGNGYVLTIGGKRIYISGDTEDTPEMRGLKDIDYAFVCMNLPYTMTEEQAASAVLAFKPKVVFPYHYRYRGREMMGDIDLFKKLLGPDSPTEVRVLPWYDDRPANPGAKKQE